MFRSSKARRGSHVSIQRSGIGPKPVPGPRYAASLEAAIAWVAVSGKVDGTTTHCLLVDPIQRVDAGWNQPLGLMGASGIVLCNRGGISRILGLLARIFAARGP